MNDWTELVNFAVEAAGLTVALIGLFISISARRDKKTEYAFFVTLFALIVIYVGSALTSTVSLDFLGEGYTALSRVALFTESFSSSLLMPLLILFLLDSTGESFKKSPAFYIAAVLWTIYFALLIITQFTTEIYYFTFDNVYHRGALYPVLLVPPVLIMADVLALLIVKRSKLTKRKSRAFFIYIIVPLCCMLIQMMFYGLLIIVFGTAVSAFLMLLLIFREQMEESVKKAEENARLNASVAMLQMRPHFICNTMTSIYYLIEQDQKKAQRVTKDFTSYLRKNLTAVCKEGEIPFTDELEHTRAYLSVEQVRYEGRLSVSFDTPVTNFRLPPLTLQPLVENAVKHGLSPENGPLEISVRTAQTGDGTEITVEDTGPGFVEDNSGDGAHIGLSNVRSRLSAVGGALKISPRDGGGTVVTVVLPGKK